MTETTATRTRSTRTRTLGRVASTVVALAVGAGAGLGAAGTASAATVHPGSATTVTAATAAPATPAQMQAQFLTLLNDHRTANGEKALRVSADLVAVAHGWSVQMAAGNNLAHNPNLATQVQNWEVVGENVGDGTDVATLDTAFWNSPGHRANELYAAFTDVGISVVTSGGTVWVTYDFRQELNPVATVTPPTAAQKAAAAHKAAVAKKHAAAKRAAARKHAQAKRAAARRHAAAKRAAAKRAAAKRAAARRHHHSGASAAVSAAPRDLRITAVPVSGLTV